MRSGSSRYERMRDWNTLMCPGQFIGLIQNRWGDFVPPAPCEESSRRSGPYMFSPYFSRWPERL